MFSSPTKMPPAFEFSSAVGISRSGSVTVVADTDDRRQRALAARIPQITDAPAQMVPMVSARIYVLLALPC
jgi:hypothetical protein